VKLHEAIQQKGKSISFEFFPPKDEAAEKRLFAVIRKLENLKPDLVSVTYGAGGSTSKNTRRIVNWIKTETALEPMPHLTCVDQSSDELNAILEDYRLLGVENVLALRGDPPQGATGLSLHRTVTATLPTWYPLPLNEPLFLLVLRATPRPHRIAQQGERSPVQRQRSMLVPICHYQMFFDNRHFYDYLDRARKIGIQVPIIPGIMPIFDINRIADFCDKCGATLPEAAVKRLKGASPGDARRIGRDIAVEQVQDLLSHGVRSFHFYTMNQADTVTDICIRAGLDRM
jgi:methylenetetrahydrofolate reductase (NADPH)